MSELIERNDNHLTIHCRLLSRASALVLAASFTAMGTAHAGDSDRPQVWLEVGGGLDRLGDGQEIFTPPFLASEPAQFSSPLKALQSPLYSMDLSGAISVRPEDSKWNFSASIRYGRSSKKSHFHQQSYPAPATKYFFRSSSGIGHTNHYTQQPFAAQFIDVQSKNSENHAIIDFQVGRDVGLGLFGASSSSSLNLGIRIAQFTSKSRASLHEDPDWAFHVYHYTFANPPYFSQRIEGIHQPYHSYAGEFDATRSFHGIGPSISWKSSAPFAGTAQDGALALDWGVNASLLFGRQKAKTQHHETGRYHSPGVGFFGARLPGPLTTFYHHPTDAPAYHSTRSRGVTVPNIGGFAGMSFNYPNAKISVGYRADFFFGAIDGGIGTRRTYDRNFYGPYATIAIGLGG